MAYIGVGLSALGGGGGGGGGGRGAVGWPVGGRRATPNSVTAGDHIMMQRDQLKV